ncbi:MAG TPA: zinc-dependent metalloprotease family protein [Polyangiaceae bacterium]|nr:zinc-dependent metalloprotease family protein [Polyangiaceae bacterium]
MRTSRRELLRWAAGLAGGLATRGAWAENPAPLIVLQPLGAAMPGAEIAAVSEALTAFYRVRLQVADTVALPKSAFYPQRQRYRAERLLDFLAGMSSPGTKIVLGLTAVDISTTKGQVQDWGILGLATLDGRSAVLSSFRCKRGAKSAAHVRARFAKTAVHELGHSFGIEHCTTPGCIMHDGEGSVLTTDGESDLCAATRARLASRGVLRDGAVSPFR